MFTLFSVFIPGRMWSLHCMGDSVQVQPGCDGLEHSLPGGQLHALVLPPVQAKAGEFLHQAALTHIQTVSQSLYIQHMSVLHQIQKLDPGVYAQTHCLVHKLYHSLLCVLSCPWLKLWLCSIRLRSTGSCDRSTSGCLSPSTCQRLYFRGSQDSSAPFRLWRKARRTLPRTRPLWTSASAFSSKESMCCCSVFLFIC